jgi:long-chain acyl-CoA synthetase
MDPATSAHFSGSGGSGSSGEPVAILEAADPVLAFAAATRGDALIALPTSGTSGLARTVVRTARSWTDSFPAIGELTGLTADSRLWLPGPLSATMNLFAAVHADWAGAALVDSLAAATHIHLTPGRLAQLLDDGADLGGRTIVVAGDALEPSLRERAESSGARVAHYYGAAELSFVAWGVDRDCLRAFPGVEINVRDGEIWVRSGYLAEGYLAEGYLAEGSPAGVDGPFRRGADGFATVGDRGRLDCDVGADRVVVDGRPDAILTGGATVLVADIEAAIRPLISGQVAVLGLPHPRLGQVVAAVLTDEADRRPARGAARGLGAGRPRRWFHRQVLPLTRAGKIDRRMLAGQLVKEMADDEAVAVTDDEADR